MALDHLWADWRRAYVEGEEGRTGQGCVLCRVIDTEDGEVAHVVHRGRHTVTVLNRFPYTNGHMMVMPLRHVGELTELDAAESAELWAELTDAVAALGNAYSPDGVNVGANLGSAAGAGLPGHLHVHALPRWKGDTNFMTSIGGTRVMPESLEDSAVRLRAGWPQR